MLRGVAASLVVFFHLTVGSPQYLAQLPWLTEVTNFGKYGVQMFFVISGFVLPYSLYRAGNRLSKFGPFLWRRVVRIDPPYLVSIVAVILLAYVSTLSPYYRGGPFQINWSDVALHVGYLNAFFHRPWLNPVYWTLAIKFQFYILLGLLFELFRNSNNVARCVILGSFLVLSLLIKDESYIFCHAPLFLMGITTFMYYEKLIRRDLFITSIVVFTIIGGFSYNWEGIWFGLITVPLILFWNTPSRSLLFLGTISYSLYLLHVPIGSRFTNLTEAFTDNAYLRIAVVPVGYAVSVLAACIFYIVIEKTAIAWSKKITLK
jgi:peptidoglycan/LPS O-acetylase OafA/YrhL